MLASIVRRAARSARTSSNRILLELLHDSDLCVSERIGFVKLKMLRDCADQTQPSTRGVVMQDTSNDSAAFFAHLTN
jgi:hypothetical protein